MGEADAALLVLGGTGFIGRHLVKYVTDRGLAPRIRVADKRPPLLSYMDGDFCKAFERVEFVQVDLATSAVKAWGGQRFAVVVNLASSMEFGKPDAWYQMNILKVRQECARAAAEVGCDKYIEVSTTAVYRPRDEKGEYAPKEGDVEDPADVVAALHLEAEQWIASHLPSLPVVVARLPVVYGPGDVHGLMPRLLCAASYIDSPERRMISLYSDDLRTHTCHVEDAAGCIWHLTSAGRDREIYNIVDDGDTTQGKLNEIITEVFPIEACCVGHKATKGLLAGEKLGDLLREANETHGQGWAALCRKHGADSCGPLSTFLYEEDLAGKPNAASNAKSKAAGYQYAVPAITAERVRQALRYWTNLRGKCMFPDVMLS